MKVAVAVLLVLCYVALVQYVMFQVNYKINFKNLKYIRIFLNFISRGGECNQTCSYNNQVCLKYKSKYYVNKEMNK